MVFAHVIFVLVIENKFQVLLAKTEAAVFTSVVHVFSYLILPNTFFVQAKKLQSKPYLPP